jgi:hypothetical protein
VGRSPSRAGPQRLTGRGGGGDLLPRWSAISSQSVLYQRPGPAVSWPTGCCSGAKSRPQVLEGAPAQALPHVRAKLRPMLAASYAVWPAAHLVNFALVPPEHRLLAVNLVAASTQAGLLLAACSAGLSGCECARAMMCRRLGCCRLAYTAAALTSVPRSLLAWVAPADATAALPCCMQVLWGVYMSHAANSSSVAGEMPPGSGGASAASAASAAPPLPPEAAAAAAAAADADAAAQGGGAGGGKEAGG